MLNWSARIKHTSMLSNAIKQATVAAIVNAYE